MMKSRFVIFSFLIIVVFSTQFFNNVNWKQMTGGMDIYYYVIYPIIFLLALPCMIKKRKRTLYSTDVKLIFVVSYLFVITIFYTGRSVSIDLDLPPMLFSMTILTYFLMLQYRMQSKTLMYCLTFVGIFVFLIQVFQQLSPSGATFGIIDPEKATINMDVAHLRNNLYRFLLPTSQLSLVCMYYWWMRLIEKRNFVVISLFICFASSVYLYLTRQIIFSAIVVFALTPFLMNKGKKARNVKKITILLAAAIFAIAPLILGDLINMTKEGGDSSENRLLSYVFFGEKIIASPVSFLFGNGTPPETIEWHKAELNASDIGVVGEVFHKGIFALLVYFMILYKLLVKNKDKTPAFVKLYVICTFINSIMSFPYIQAYEYFLWAILLYLSEDPKMYKKDCTSLKNSNLKIEPQCCNP